MTDHPDMPLHARVAVEVMGWSVCEELPSWTEPCVFRHDGEWCVAKPGVYGFWRPDLNIADAWEVVEKLDADGVIVRALTKHSGEPFWTCAMLDCRGERGYGGQLGEHPRRTERTAPLAICHAALKAVEVKTDATS